MKPEDLIRLRELVLSFYSEAATTTEQDICGSSLGLVDDQKEAKALSLRREADRIWKHDKAEAKRLHDKARALGAEG